MSGRLRIALYMRLSKEDEDVRDESGSIRTQRALLRRYVQDNFQEYSLREFLDDGYSGTNMDRPGMAKMLEAAKESSLDCIIVKDFSRFSRDYIELGSYMEQIFPFMGIRFISVNDNYDSDICRERVGELAVSFRNLMYDLYSKDLSVKVKSSLEIKKKQGKFISANSPFGYEKMPGNKHMLVIEADEAELVRRIFHMRLSGMTSAQIAKILNGEGVKTPIEYKIAKGKSSREPKGGEFSWSSSTVCQILGNQVYTGDMVYGKTYRDGAGGRNHLRPSGEWKVFQNHHEPIISREIFEEVRKSRGKAGVQKRSVGHPLTGKLVCGGCGRNLRLRSGRNPYFCCPCLYVNAKEDCVRRVNMMFAEQVILYKMQEHAEETAAADGMRKKKTKELEQRLEQLKKEQKAAQGRLRALRIAKTENYENYVKKKTAGDREMAAAEFQEGLMRIFSRESRETALLSKKSESARALEEELSGMKKSLKQINFNDFTKLTQELTQRFIRKIVVRDEQHMEISWRDGM